MPNLNQPVRSGWRFARLALAGLPLIAAAPAPPLVVLDCYLVQSGSSGLGQFVRHLEINQSRAVVAIADGIGGGPPRFVGNGRLVSLDADHVIYDFASQSSAGRTEIDRRSGAFIYRDGRTVISGSCQAPSL